MQKNTHTVRHFQFDEPLLPIVKDWAKNFGFLVEVQGNTISCEKGMGLMSAPITVILEHMNGDIKFEAFLKTDPISMFTSLFLAPDEMHLDSGDGQLYMERKYGRDKVNKLLEKLGQPIIE
ncbi:MAG: hypothetical protein GYA52_08275 [Chloroflexi bacterium]|jgi:hypothetical protein|nr:hypothetical protein [Chloroflexota bacterium]